MGDLLAGLTIATALGCGVMAGFFFAFSNLVMPSLGRIPPVHGITAMQRMNLGVANPLFMLAFLGTPALCVAMAAVGFANLDEGYAGYLIGAAALYLVGGLLMTIAYHQPRNLALGKLEATAPASEAYWRRYLAQWNPWNHVRALTSLAAAALLIVAIRV